MRSRPLTVLTVLACLNLAAFGVCYGLATKDQGASFEGLVPALMAYGTLFLSVVLAGLAWKTGLAEVRQGGSVPRAFLCAVLAAAPLLFYVFLVLLPLRLKARHGGRLNPAASGNGAITISFYAGRRGRAVPEPHCWASHNVRNIVSILLVAGSVLTSGCISSQTARESAAFDAERQRRLVEVATVEVSLPSVTPYDADVQARQAYLAYYRDGYREGLAGYKTSCCLSECPNRRARIDGWYAGQSAGWSIWSKKNL